MHAHAVHSVVVGGSPHRSFPIGIAQTWRAQATTPAAAYTLDSVRAVEDNRSIRHTQLAAAAHPAQACSE